MASIINIASGLHAHALGVEYDAEFESMLRTLSSRYAKQLRAAGDAATVPYPQYAKEVRRAEEAELHLGDFKEATAHWCNEAHRNRRAFIGASILAGVMTLAAIAEALAWWLK